jgi:polar amino acid transport system ATP-binding protein
MTVSHVSSDLLGAIGGVPRPETDVVVDARDVNKWFGRLHVLRDVSIQVKRQETVVIIGPSGSGKTTFIRCINHLEKIQSGRIFVNGHLIGYREAGGGKKLVEDKEKNIAAQRQEIGMVFQRFNLFPHMTALENIIEAPIQVWPATRLSRWAGHSSSGSGWRPRRPSTPTSSPAASNSASPSPGRWP